MEKSEFEFTFLYFKVYYCGSESHKQPIPYHTQIHCLYRDNIHSFISRTPWLPVHSWKDRTRIPPLTTHLLPDSESRLAITIEPALIIMGSIFKDYQDSERNCEPQLLPCLSQGEKKWIRIHFFVFQSILSKINSSGYPADHRIPYQYPQPKPYVQPLPLVDDFKDLTDFRSQ